MCAFCRPSPSTPRRIIFISLLVCKTTEKIVIERNSCFSVSGIQCSNVLHHTQEEPRPKGRIGCPPVAIIRCTLHCRLTTLLLLNCNPNYFLCGCWWWKVESNVVDPDRWSCKLVGWCPQVAAPKNAVTQGGVYIFPHTAFGLICFSSQNHNKWYFEETILNWKPKGEFESAGTEVEVGRCCQVDGRDKAHATSFHFGRISSVLAVMMFQ